MLWLAVFSASTATGAEVPECRTAQPLSKSEKFKFEYAAESDPFARSIGDDMLVGKVSITRYNVFNMDDPREANWLYRLANKVNFITHESVIRSQLLFAEGDSYNPALLAESERLLRELDFLYDARVIPVKVCGKRVDLEVVTRDIWTLKPSFSISRSGGDNSSALGLSDSNVFGTGKGVGYIYEDDPDRSGHTFFYNDPAVFGSRWNMHLNYSDNSDGYLRNVAVERPFFSVRESWAAGSWATQGKLEEATWFRGDEVTEFNHEFEDYRVYAGLAPHPDRDRDIGRWRAGIHYQTNEFSYSDSNIPPEQLPADRDYVYPFIGYESIEDQFLEVWNMNYIGRTEDFYTGQRYWWSLGWSAESFGASRDQLAIAGEYQNTLKINKRSMWQVEGTVNGFVGADEGDFENLWLTLGTTYFLRQHDRWTFFGRARVDYTEGLTEDRQVLLGGDSGLRGYDRNYQVGDRSFVVNLEERYYTNLHVFQLFRVGAAAFVDVGRAWYDDRDNGENGGVLADAGFGLRLNSSRARKRRVIHVDLAFPLVTGQDVDSVQLLFKVRETF